MPTNTVLQNASDSTLTLSGQSCVLFYNDKHSVETIVLVSPYVNHSVLVGWEDLMVLHVIPSSFPAVAASTATPSYFDRDRSKILNTFTQNFLDNLGTQPMRVPPMDTYLKENARIQPFQTN